MAKLWKSTFIFSSMTMLSRIMGMVRDVVLMNIFGAGALMDAFLVAFKIPNFLRRLFAEGAFSQAFVPVLSEYKTNKGLQEVQVLISHTSGSLLIILLILTCAVLTLSPVVVKIFAPGFDGNQFELTVELLRITFPYLLFISMTAFAGSILNSYQHFAMPALAPVFLNLSFIVAALVVAPHLPKPIMALGWAVFFAGIIQFALQLPELWKRKLLVPPKVDFKHEGVRRILKLMLPALFGVSVTQINLLLNTIFASLMQTGSVSWLYAGERMSELPMGLIGVAIGTVILPSLSAQTAAKDTIAFKNTLDWAAKVILLVGIPASTALFLLSDILIQTLFMHGEFDQLDAKMSALSLKALAGGVMAFMLIKIFAPGFFARQDTKTPVKIGIISVVSNIVFSIMFIYIFKIIDIPLHVALALSSTCAAFVNAGLLYYHLHKQNIFRFGKHWKKILSQYLFANTVMIAVLLGCTFFVFNNSLEVSQWQRIIYLGCLCVVGAVSYALALLATGFRPNQLRQ